MRSLDHFGFIFAICLFTIATLISCGESDNTMQGKLCADTSECTEYETCLWARCLSSCKSDRECPTSLYCHPKGVCTECASHNHCALDEICAFGSCEIAEDGEEYGLPCNNDASCLNGEICLDDRCTQLCSQKEDCRAPRSMCNLDGHYCVECLSDTNCEENEECIDGLCNLIEPDGDMDNEIEAEQEEEAASLAQISEPCSFKADPALPECEEGLECLFNSKVSFCSNPCEKDQDCYTNFPNGCCLPLSTLEGKSYCLTESFCELLAN